MSAIASDHNGSWGFLLLRHHPFWSTLEPPGENSPLKERENTAQSVCLPTGIYSRVVTQLLQGHHNHFFFLFFASAPLGCPLSCGVGCEPRKVSGLCPCVTTYFGAHWCHQVRSLSWDEYGYHLHGSLLKGEPCTAPMPTHRHTLPLRARFALRASRL